MDTGRYNRQPPSITITPLLLSYVQRCISRCLWHDERHHRQGTRPAPLCNPPRPRASIPSIHPSTQTLLSCLGIFVWSQVRCEVTHRTCKRLLPFQRVLPRPFSSRLSFGPPHFEPTTPGLLAGTSAIMIMVSRRFACFDLESGVT